MPADVPESAVSACGKTSMHAHHDWVEQTGSIDYEHWWCPGVAPATEQRPAQNEHEGTPRG